MNDVFTISIVEPFIENRGQYLRFFLKEKPASPLICQYSDINKFQITEVEMLIGSFCKPVFFDLGEQLPSGKLITEKNRWYNVKRWRIMLNGTIDECRERNKSHLLSFETIKNIQPYQTKSLGDPSNKQLNISVKESNNKYLISIYELKRTIKLSIAELNILEGAMISPICYVHGEISEYTGYPINGNPGDTIVKNLNLRLPNGFSLKNEKY